MRFEFLKVSTALDSIEIEDVGNVCLECADDDGLKWYLKIKTELGWCFIEQFGPLKYGESDVRQSFSFFYREFEFSEKTLFKTIDRFLNEKKEVTSVLIIEPDEFKDKLDEVMKCLVNR